MLPIGRPPTGGPARPGGPSRPIQKFPAHPGKQKIFAPGRAGSEYPVVAITGPCSTKVVFFVNHFCHAAMIVQMQKKNRRHGAKLPKLVVFHFCPTVQLPIWSTLWYFTFEYLSQLGMETTKKVRKAVPCLFDIEILRLAASFGCLFGCISVVPIKVTETLVQWVARNVLEIQTARLGQDFFSKPGLFLNS